MIPTPALDRLAKSGLRYTQFHSTAPARRRGPRSSPGGTTTRPDSAWSRTIDRLPRLQQHHPKDKATIGRILKDNGFATSWFGKDHNTPTFTASQVGPFDQWPSGMGFDYFYGFVGGDTSQWEPNLFRNTTEIYPYVGKPGWNLTTAQADDAIDWLHRVNQIDPSKPFFCYYVPGGTHAPHHATPEWIEKISKLHLFDEGWNKLRDTIFANQKRLGVIPQDAKMTPWPKDLLKTWDQLTPDEKKMFIRQVDVYAAYLAYTDHEIGRVIQAVEDMGKLDNTLVIYISGDNGSSAEGTLIGTPNEVAMFNGGHGARRGPVEAFLRCLGLGQDLQPHGRAVDLGLRHALLLDQADRLALRRHAARDVHLLAGPHQGRGRHPQPVPSHHRRRSHPAGSQRYPSTRFGGRHPAKPDRRHELRLHLRPGQRQRAVAAPHTVFRDDGRPRHLSRRLDCQHQGHPPALGGFGAVNTDPMNNCTWELYDLSKDWTQDEDVAAKYPAKVQEMKALFLQEARKYNVLPLDASVASRLVQPRPNITAGRSEFVYTRPMTGLPQGDSPLLLNCSYNIAADIEIPQGGAEGMILTSGGRFAGYGFYLLKGKPVFLWNLADLKRVRWEGPDALAAGKHVVEFDFKYDGLGPGTLAFNNMSGIGRGGTGVLKVDGKEVVSQKMEKTLPLILQWDESFDIGSDTGTPVDDQDYQCPFTFTGKLNKLTLKLDRPQLSPEDIKKLEAAQRNNKVSE